ncbi:hypothetical protein FHW16_005315 [Phyllobacterium myrsinacearum]|uniref:Uncharacterized protein n=1 Tax=Phyllobacterium myrsinacearum TaxID=28101 RepID=A0A839EVN1_9HYPH|nr:hypothetical protein [Phyllobacterium myrsinacearum]
MPGFAYWLLLLLVAASTFWICGGHVLFSQDHGARPYAAGINILAPSRANGPVTGR